MVIYRTEGNKQIAYSDQGFYIHGGEPEGDYAEAIDPVDAGRTYTETTELIDPPTVEEKAAAFDIITGGAE